MAGKQIVQTIKMNFETEIGNLRSSISQIQTEMNKVKIPQSSTNTINKDLATLSDKLKELESKNKDGIIKLDDVKDIEKISNKITEIFSHLGVEMKNIGGLSDKLLPPEVLKSFNNLEKAIETAKNHSEDLYKAQKKLNSARNTRATKSKQFEEEKGKKVIKDEDYNNLTKFSELQKVHDKIQKKATVNGNVDKRKYTKADKETIAEYERLKQVIESVGYSSEDVGKILKQVTSQAKLDNLQAQFNAANLKVEELEKNLNDLKTAGNNVSFDKIKQQAEEMGVNIKGVTSIEELQSRIDAFKTTQIDNAKASFDKLSEEIKEGSDNAQGLGKKVKEELRTSADGANQLNSEFDQFSNRIKYFFGMTNAIQLFKRALRQSIESIKELDSAMLKIAVVSEYDMGDMWKTLPQFTKQANELGVAVTEVYDATGLYVQQGLDLVESQGLANETLKMAKIAGMDAAAATDAMTSALRGFNMELNQGSAQKVNDIYSKLAAITASDTQEIATAMSKTASIANNAGASIENTSAFLSMIIETTRESAETAGTALKTVIARFSELKKNPAEIGDVDGEIVDANQIESALRLADVDLRDAAGQFRNFDEVIIELSGKWDTLDKNTQRYIATMAAGSRQQSRFLALMSDSDRLVQLTDAAYNSAGASTTQFNKTLDSLESKMNQLKNAWNTFTQSLMNSELIKTGVEILTDIITTINGITNAFSNLGSFLGTTLSTTLVVVFFVLGRKIATGLIESVATGLQGFGERIKAKLESESQEVESAGQSAGAHWSQGWAKGLRIAGVATMAVGMAASIAAQKLREAGDEEGARKWEEWASYISMFGMALIMVGPIIKMFSKEFRKEMLKNTKSFMKFAGIALIIVGIIGIAKEIGEIIASNTAEGKLKALNKEVERATEAANKAQEAYSEWLSDKNEYNGLTEALKELTKGTEAWSVQMDKVQDKVYEMINTYPELAKYLQEDGTLSEDGVKEYDKKLKKDKELKMGMKMAAEIARDTQQYNNEISNLESQYRSGEITEDYYTAKTKELTRAHNASSQGKMNYMAQGAGVEGYMSDNISAAMNDKGYADKMAQKIQQRKAELKGDHDTLAATSDIAGNAALGLGGLALFAAANAWNPVGWVAGIAAGLGTVVWGITEWLEGDNLDELQEAYSKAFGIPVDEINEDIKEDADALASAVAEKEIYEEFRKELEWAEAQLYSLGSNAQKLLAEDLSLLDQDFSEFGGFKKWVESLKDEVNESSDVAIDDAYKKFKEKTKETVDSVNRIFGGKVKFKYQVRGDEIVENNVTGLTMSGVEGGQLSAAENSLRETFSDNTINALNSVMQSYADNQVSVNELTGAYIELGNAATITQKAVAAKKMFETGTQNIKTLAATFMVAEANALSATNQIREFYMNLSADQMNEIFKNGMTTAQSIMEMGATFTDLNGIIDTTGINFATLSDVLNDVKSGILSVDDLTQGFVETLDTLNKAEHIVEDTMARIATFKEPTSGRTIGEKTGKISKKLTDLILEGRYGDPALEAYFDFMFGEDAWNKALKEAEYDAEKAMSKYAKIIQNLSEDVKFFDVWKQTANQSEGLWSVDGNTINFDFGVASSYEDLITRIEKVTGWSQQFIETALADAQIWSKDLKGTIQQLTQVDALNTYLNNLEVIDGKVTLDKEQLEKIFNDMSDDVKKKFGYSYDAFEADVAKKLTGSGYAVQTSANQNLSYESKRSNLFNEFKNTYGKNGIIQDVEFGKLSSNLVMGSTEKTKDEYAEEMVEWSFSKNEFNKQLEDFGWTGLTDEQKEDLYKRTRADYLERIKQGIYVSEALGMYGTTNLGYAKYKGEGYTKEDVSGYKKLMTDTMGLYIEEGMSTWEAANKVEEDFSKSTKMAAAFNQPIESFEDEQNGLYSELKEIFNENSEEYRNWLSRGVTEEEAQLIRQADLINQGTIKAMDYLIKSGALDQKVVTYDSNGKAYSTWLKATDVYTNEKGERVGYAEFAKGYDADIEAIKYLDKYGVQKRTTSTVGSGPNANKQWYTAEQLGITSDGKAKSYNLTAEEARKVAESALKQIDFDWMHNFNELGEKITRTLDNLSTEFELAVKTLSKTSEELTQNLAEQYANMEAEAIVSQAKADAAQQRMQGMLTKNTDLTKYTWYEDGMVKINYDKIDADKADYNMTEKTKILLDELVGLAEVINENEQTQLDVDMKQAEFLEEITNTVIDFENQVRDMIIEQYEEEIDKLEQIDSAINDANSKLINSIQKSLERFRQDRENEKTEGDIEDKQRRLALLRADTSGANRGAIMSLEKEIGESQEDYTDTLIDQKISALQEQNEEASAQRQEQIDIANNQLENAKENGAINAEVRDLLDKSDTFEGSPLETLWERHLSKQGLSEEEWEGQLNDFKTNFLNYSANKSFKEQYMSGSGDINSDLAEKIGHQIPDLSASEQRITEAINGYVINSQKEIQNAIKGLSGKITPQKGISELYSLSNLKTLVNNLSKTGGKVNVKDFTNHGWYKNFVKEGKQAGYSEEQIKNFLRPYISSILWNSSAYATGGLNTQTGPAWLDGTPSKPELVLNPTDTQNFLMLKDILSDIMHGGSFTTNQKDGDINLEIYLNVEQGISNDYDVEQLVTKVKQEIAKVGRERNIQILTKR